MTMGVIQARMASTRFPGKSLAELRGKPMLQWVIEAAKSFCPAVVVATTEGDEDDPISELAESMGVDVFRRGLRPLRLYDWYLAVGREYRLTSMIRICGDTPLLSSEIGWETLRQCESWDYTTATFGGKVGSVTEYGISCEAFALNALERRAAIKELHMEHVTTAFYLHPRTTPTWYMEVNALRGVRFRGTVDTREDLDRLERRIGDYGRFPQTLEEVRECMCT